MRKLVMTTTALLAIAFAAPSFAQSNSSESAPQPGLPPGAGFRAPNAQPPRATGDVVTTPTGPSAAPSGPVATAPRTLAASRTARSRRLRARAARRARVATPAPAAPAQ